MFRSIQYLRGIAALAVVAKHAFHPPLEDALGYGVDLFFVISGFVMVASTQRPTTPAQFLARRAWRILPMWWLTLALVVVVGLSRGSAAQLALSFLLVPYGLESGVGIVSWGVGWTLCFEALFYLIFAVGLSARNWVLIPLAMAALLATGVFVGRPTIPFLHNATHPMLMEFLFGYAIAKAVYSGRALSPWLIVPGVVLLTLSIAFLPSNTYIRPISAGFPLALILAGLVASEDRLPESRVLHFFGDASYSIYLLHYVPILLLSGLVGGFILFVCAVAVGCGAYLLIERRILRAGRAISLRENRRPAQSSSLGSPTSSSEPA